MRSFKLRRGMGGSTDARRRWAGLIVLGSAAAMLIGGQTILAQHLDGLGFIIYWLVCFGLTVTAILVALADLRALRRQTREAHRALVRETFGGLEEKPDRQAGKKSQT